MVTTTRVRCRPSGKNSASTPGVPLLAGAGTLTEMLTLAGPGLEVMEFFPAEAAALRP